MADVFTKQKRSAIMARIHGKHTSPEKRLKTLLRAAGIGYRSYAKDLPGTPDIVLRGTRVAVFINGCFWHGHLDCKRSKLPVSNVSFWRRKIQGNMRRDSAQRRRLRSQGWGVLTYWTCRRPELFAARVTRYLAAATR